ncbi:MAG: ergothioneine biosynthesis protein EgtB [Rhizobiales bacterium]|nr:ergothioneine biosynthesis protein EgtB [Hyphomicrobiales bacterium]
MPRSAASLLKRDDKAKRSGQSAVAIIAAARQSRAAALHAFYAVRAETEALAARLTLEDQVVQSMPDASPIKWHRAHVTWFFEQFLLHPMAKGYKSFDTRFDFLFNSYYVALGPRHARPQRGLVTRPNGEDILAYREHVDSAVAALIEGADDKKLAKVLPVVEIGLHHEQQHQELILTDILHAFAQNPTDPIYDADWTWPRASSGKSDFAELAAGIHPIGHEDGSFCFDNELPVHRVLLRPVRIARQLVTNGEWLAFMQDGGYTTPSLWLSDGWAQVEAEGWRAPGHWRDIDGEWSSFTLAGTKPVERVVPVCHISYYEADAFARWSGKYLPTEEEWEVAARAGHFADAFGMVWQWTRSAYSPYPGYRAAPGALGEYNGKFMVNQMVLRGSSFATPAGHARSSYRNFFYPPARWQFTGLRLADYAD